MKQSTDGEYPGVPGNISPVGQWMDTDVRITQNARLPPEQAYTTSSLPGLAIRVMDIIDDAPQFVFFRQGPFFLRGMGSKPNKPYLTKFFSLGYQGVPQVKAAIGRKGLIKQMPHQTENLDRVVDGGIIILKKLPSISLAQVTNGQRRQPVKKICFIFRELLLSLIKPHHSFL